MCHHDHCHIIMEVAAYLTSDLWVKRRKEFQAKAIKDKEEVGGAPFEVKLFWVTISHRLRIESDL